MEDNHDEPMLTEEEMQEQMLVNEEYKIWKKHTPLLYDLLYSRALEWPTLTTQWFPDVKQVPDSKLREHRILFGTNTTNGGPNYLQIARLQVPDFSVPDPAKYNENTGEIGGWGDAPKPFQYEIVQRINHPSEVNKARYMPQNPNIIGSMGVGGAVLVFDRTKHPLTPKDNEIRAEIELTGHTDEGYGMSWNPHVEGQLVTASQDQTVRLWDITANTSANSNGLPATRVFEHHHSIVNDVEFHPKHSFFLASVSDDHTLQVIDTRQKDDDKAAIKNVNAHNDAVNCVAWHPKWEWIMATGSADRTVALWDFRNMKEKLHSIENAVKDSVIKLEWNPQDPSVLAAGSYDRRIVMLDISRTGEEQTTEEAEEGPPELMFMHGGFTNRVSDFSWNRNDPWVMLAAADDNQMQVFRPAYSIICPPKAKSPVTMQDIED